MSIPTSLRVTLSLLVLCGVSALHPADKNGKEADEPPAKEPRMIGDIAAVAGLQPYPLQGVGLVVNLDDTGSDPLPGPERTNLLLDMQKRGVERAEELLRSPRTALVRIRAMVPPGIRSCKSMGCWCRDPKRSRRDDAQREVRPHLGDTFDIEVEVPSRDLTKSLEGGWLLEAWLYEVAALGGDVIGGHVRARASGPVMVAAGIEGESADPAAFRRGRVLGGGIAHQDSDFALLIESERTSRWTIQIASRINDRFQTKNRQGKPVAEAKTSQRIALRIPPQYRQNMARYLEVLRFMPVYEGEAEQAERVNRLGEQLLVPELSRIAAVKLEGIGFRSIDTLKEGLASTSPDVRFFAAEALSYLDEPAAAGVLAETARDVPEYRAHALAALGSLDEAVSRIKLVELMNEGDSVELLYGAFRALRALEPKHPAIPEEIIDDYLHLHRVASRLPVVHVSSRDRAEIVLFGSDHEMQTPLLLHAGRTIMLHASKQGSQVHMSRIAIGQPTQRLVTDTDLDEIIRGTVRLGGTYPDVVGMLVSADKNRNLPSRLELDAMPDPTRMAVRLRKLSSAPDAPAENVAMPNLFRWLEPDNKGSTPRTESGDTLAHTDSGDPQKPKKYLSKPSLWDRLRGRSAN